MKQIKKAGRKKYKGLKEDIFNHLDSVYRSARRSKNYTAALKAVELCLKAKHASLKASSPLMHMHDLSDEELEKILNTIQQEVVNLK